MSVETPVKVHADLHIKLPFFSWNNDQNAGDLPYQRTVRNVSRLGLIALGVAALTASLTTTMAGMGIATVGVAALAFGTMIPGGFSLSFIAMAGLVFKISTVVLATLFLQKFFLVSGMSFFMGANKVSQVEW